jgi:hypothetical protein
MNEFLLAYQAFIAYTSSEDVISNTRTALLTRGEEHFLILWNARANIADECPSRYQSLAMFFEGASCIRGSPIPSRQLGNPLYNSSLFSWTMRSVTVAALWNRHCLIFRSKSSSSSAAERLERRIRICHVNEFWNIHTQLFQQSRSIWQ